MQFLVLQQYHIPGKYFQRLNGLIDGRGVEGERWEMGEMVDGSEWQMGEMGDGSEW